MQNHPSDPPPGDFSLNSILTPWIPNWRIYNLANSNPVNSSLLAQFLPTRFLSIDFWYIPSKLEKID